MVKILLNTVKQSSTASYLLDLIRFLSALIVFLLHFGYGVPGYQAVMVFFVLSGYFISTGVMKGISNGNWSWKNYLTKRLVRLYIVLVPALIITFVVAKIQIYLFGGADYFEGTLDLKTIIGNLFYLQGIEVERLGLNGPLWSLAYEFWYYILFPVIILAFKSKKWTLKVLYFAIFIAISLLVGKLIMLYFLIWLLGAGIAVLKAKCFNNKYVNYVVLMALLVLVYYSTSVPYELANRSFSYDDPIFGADLVVGISFAALVYWIVAMFNESYPKWNLNLFKKLAGFSYTLYLVHYPFKYLWLAWIRSDYWHINEPLSLKIRMVYMLGVVILCYLLAQVTEEKTSRVVKKVQSLYGK